MTNISTSLVNMLYNLQLMRIAGEDGVAAYGVIMYVNFIFIAVFIGYSIGSAPIVGYHYGAGHHDELKNLLRRSLRIVGLFGISMLILAETCAGPLTQFFVGYDAELQAMTNHGFRLYCLAFLVNGFNIYGSAFFTALNNGAVSADDLFPADAAVSDRGALSAAAVSRSQRNLAVHLYGGNFGSLCDDYFLHQDER